MLCNLQNKLLGEERAPVIGEQVNLMIHPRSISYFVLKAAIVLNTEVL